MCNDDCAKVTFTVLEEAVKAGDLEIIQHKAVQTIIDVKWNQFGKRGGKIEISFEKSCNVARHCL